MINRWRDSVLTLEVKADRPAKARSDLYGYHFVI